MHNKAEDRNTTAKSEYLVFDCIVSFDRSKSNASSFEAQDGMGYLHQFPRRTNVYAIQIQVL